MAKIIRLTETDLKNLVKRVIKEQSSKGIAIVTPGSNAEAEIVVDKKGKKLIVTTESGRTQEVYVQTPLPQGKFMFEMGKDGKRMFGYEPKTKKKMEIYVASFK